MLRPPGVGPVVVGAEPTTAIAAVRAQEERAADRILDGLVHGDDPPETHSLDLCIREHLAYEASDLNVRGREVPLLRFSADLLRDPIVVREERAFEHRDQGCDARGRLELLGTQDALGVVAHAQSLPLQPLNPLLAGRAIGGHQKGNDSVLLAPEVSGL